MSGPVKPGTALPWALSGDCVQDLKGNPIPHYSGFVSEAWLGNDGTDESRANARYIITACNAFPALYEALKEAKAALNAAQFQVDAEWRGHDKKVAQYDAIVRAFRDKCEAALSLATGETK